MIQARGIMFLASRAFVRETFGAEAHDKVIARLPPDLAAAFADLREGGWKPLKALSAYVEVSRHLFAPDDDGYYRRLGVHVGQIERKQGGFSPMVVNPRVAMRMAPLVWRALYDTGRLEFRALGPHEGIALLTGFPYGPVACGTTAGAMEGLTSTDERRVVVRETDCRGAGSEACRFSVVWL